MASRLVFRRCFSTNPLDVVKDRSLLKTDGFINNKWVSSGKKFAVRNPASRQIIAEVANLDQEHAKEAIVGAEAGFALWRNKPVKERSAILKRWFDLIVANADDLARIMTSEQGKPLPEARGEVIYGASFVDWFAEEAKRAYGETIPSSDPSKRYLTIRQPIGVCCAITPWNFPLAMITRKVSPALAAGCSVLVKPAEQTPLSALAAAELALRAGLPPGVFQVVPSDADGSIRVGKVWCDSSVVRHLSFTGSTEVGKILMKQSAGTVKKVALELGGNAPFIVFDDADLNQAVEGALISKFRNAGQTCVCANRIYVQSGVYDAFVDKLAQRTAQLKVGSGFEEGVSVGPLIDESALRKAAEHIDDAVKKGARVVNAAGGAPAPAGPQFMKPVVLAGVTQQMKCATEETFGPVAPVFRFQTEEEVIRMANATDFGLASYVYSRDIGRVFRVSEALEYGMVGVNTGLISTAEVPFGGVKQSGIGREGSKYGLDEYMEIKYICLGGIQ